MFESAVRVAEHVKYAGAGTFEFIVDGRGNFYFLEMNTRLQVEHPVTEWVTGMDLVAWQLLLAAGEFTLPTVPERRGAAIEVRLYAEDPHTFLPAPGPLGLIQMPTGAFVRSDSAFGSEGEVSVHYDPMIAKISVWAPTREETVDRLRVALDEARVEPPRKPDGTQQGSLRTNLAFLRRLVRNDTVRGGDTTTDLIASNPALTAAEPDLLEGGDFEAAMALSLHQLLNESAVGAEDAGANRGPVSNWQQISRRDGVRL
jgi:acetyl-CoA carboxylase biotin carboxylase subunit